MENKKIRIDDIWGTQIVQGFINGGSGIIIARISGLGYERNLIEAQRIAREWMKL